MKLTTRQQRALRRLLKGPAGVDELRKATGALQVYDLVDQLRGKGFVVPCPKIDVVDRDGRPCRPGRYEFTSADRRKAIAALT